MGQDFQGPLGSLGKNFFSALGHKRRWRLGRDDGSFWVTVALYGGVGEIGSNRVQVEDRDIVKESRTVARVLVRRLPSMQGFV